MNFQESISAFMDRALTPDEEADFLHTLSVSPEKLDVFHDFMGTRSAFVADMQSTTVPSHLDAAVLTGTRIPVAPPPAAPAGFWSLKRGLLAAVAAGVFFVTGMLTESMLTTATAVTGAATEVTARTGGEGAGNAAPSVATEPRTGSGTGDAVNARMRREGDEARQGAARPARMPANPASGDGADSHRRALADATNDAFAAVAPPRDTVWMAGRTVVVRDTVKERLHDTLTITRNVPVNLADIDGSSSRSGRGGIWAVLGNIDIEVQREHLNTNPYINYRKLAVDRAQQNMAVLAAYNFDVHHAIGVMFGQKAFAQEYYRIQADSIHLYQQQPLLNYGGGFYRYSLPITRGIVPQLMIQLGGSDLGPIVGSRLSVRFMPINHFSIIVGANASLLAYRYNGKVFTSNSIGLLYGVNIAF